MSKLIYGYDTGHVLLRLFIVKAHRCLRVFYFYYDVRILVWYLSVVLTDDEAVAGHKVILHTAVKVRI